MRRDLQQRHGFLNFIDLAGSERLGSSGSLRDKTLLQEAQSINYSLSCLSNVISALRSKKSHVPFRDSKLTFLLQGSLGGESKTVMIANLSPEAESMPESINTMRFAERVNSTEMGPASRGKDPAGPATSR